MACNKIVAPARRLHGMALWCYSLTMNFVVLGTMGLGYERKFGHPEAFATEVGVIGASIAGFFLAGLFLTSLARHLESQVSRVVPFKQDKDTVSVVELVPQKIIAVPGERVSGYAHANASNGQVALGLKQSSAPGVKLAQAA